MITKETAVKIWNAHTEIEKAKILLEDMVNKTIEDVDKSGKLEFKDAFGSKTGLQLGVPCSSSGHSLYHISPKLALEVIKEHIKSNKNRLIELETICQIELIENHD